MAFSFRGALPSKIICRLSYLESGEYVLACKLIDQPDSAYWEMTPEDERDLLRARANMLAHMARVEIRKLRGKFEDGMVDIEFS